MDSHQMSVLWNGFHPMFSPVELTFNRSKACTSLWGEDCKLFSTHNKSCDFNFNATFNNDNDYEPLDDVQHSLESAVLSDAYDVSNVCADASSTSIDELSEYILGDFSSSICGSDSYSTSPDRHESDFDESYGFLQSRALNGCHVFEQILNTEQENERLDCCGPSDSVLLSCIDNIGTRLTSNSVPVDPKLSVNCGNVESDAVTTFFVKNSMDMHDQVVTIVEMLDDNCDVGVSGETGSWGEGRSLRSQHVDMDQNVTVQPCRANPSSSVMKGKTCRGKRGPYKKARLINPKALATRKRKENTAAAKRYRERKRQVQQMAMGKLEQTLGRHKNLTSIERDLSDAVGQLKAMFANYGWIADVKCGAMNK